MRKNIVPNDFFLAKHEPTSFKTLDTGLLKQGNDGVYFIITHIDACSGKLGCFFLTRAGNF